VIAWKAPDKKTKKSGDARGQAQLSSRAKLPNSSIADGPVLMRTVWLTQPDGLPMARGISLHTKKGKRHKGKAHMVSWSKLFSCSPNMLARRSFYVISQQRNLSHTLKQNGRIK
jgi:hypothetical protein